MTMVLVVSLDQIARRHPPALLKDLELLRDFGQAADDLLVAPGEAVDGVRDADVVAEAADVDLGLAQVVARDARVQVVHGLELQAAMEEVEPGRAVDVHGGAEHLLGKGFVHAEVGRAHGEVGERDLDV